MLYNYDYEQLQDEGTLTELAEEITGGSVYDKEDFYEMFRNDIEAVIVEAVEEEYPDVDDNEKEDLIGEAIETDFEELAELMTEGIKEELISRLGASEDAIADTLRYLED